jgi:translation initiation factor IF-3
VIGPDGSQLGIKPLPDALQLAREQDLDLVEVAGQANPPVVKVMDFGKYKYEEAQRAKESRRKSTNISIKEMKYRPKIGVGDFDTKTRKVSEFLSEGHKVKITIMFRGREVFHPELGAKILDSIADHVAPVGKVETHARLDGRNMTMVLAPDKRAQAAAKREPREPSDTAPGDVPPEDASAPGDAPEAEAPAPDAVPAAAEPAAPDAAPAAPDAAPVVPATASAPPEPQG